MALKDKDYTITYNNRQDNRRVVTTNILELLQL
jgi:hypothetical protein